MFPGWVFVRVGLRLRLWGQRGVFCGGCVRAPWWWRLCPGLGGGGGVESSGAVGGCLLPGGRRVESLVVVRWWVVVVGGVVGSGLPVSGSESRVQTRRSVGGLRGRCPDCVVCDLPSRADFLWAAASGRARSC